MTKEVHTTEQMINSLRTHYEKRVKRKPYWSNLPLMSDDHILSVIGPRVSTKGGAWRKVEEFLKDWDPSHKKEPSYHLTDLEKEVLSSFSKNNLKSSGSEPVNVITISNQLERSVRSVNGVLSSLRRKGLVKIDVVHHDEHVPRLTKLAKEVLENHA